MSVLIDGTKAQPVSSGAGLCNLAKCGLFSTVRGCSFSQAKMFNSYMSSERKESPMFVVAVVICLLLFVALAGADLLVSNINSDELSNMGIEKKP
jgi:hypothetical protein